MFYQIPFSWQGLEEIGLVNMHSFWNKVYLSSDTFNFCFYNENGEWDNNLGNNYVFQIEKKPTELIVLEDEPVSLGSVRKLRKSYIWSKKIRLAVYKIITYLPKLISGNYRKKASDEIK